MSDIVFSSRVFALQKKFSLTISRGVRHISENLIVFLSRGDKTGIGEMVSSSEKGWYTEDAISALNNYFDEHRNISSIQETWQDLFDRNVSPPAMAAVDMALWDLVGQELNLPLYKLWEAPLPCHATSVTVGADTSELVKERIGYILAHHKPYYLKIKLGLPGGVDNDKELFSAAQETIRGQNITLRVDANGGWSLKDAIHMDQWLSQKSCDYIEQPLCEDEIDGLPFLFKRRQLPIFLDESISFSKDIPVYADHVDGVNLKLMKCGGITEAFRIICTAKAHNLKTMIGCMSESQIGISAACHLTGMLDFVDLDSHLNLINNPATGTSFIEGIIRPSPLAGHGAKMILPSAEI
ncbi:MAG: dipeptide epimerase [Rhodospirillales bacterium]|nr:dipeptide epimerase [Rhodospirillales bacterium]MCB9964904.1 dipeptide epimerase [Rhodospirillales bacterium]